MTVETFGTRLQAFRKAKGMNSTEMARTLQTNRTTLWRWENDRSRPSFEKLQKLEEMGFPR